MEDVLMSNLRPVSLPQLQEDSWVLAFLFVFWGRLFSRNLLLSTSAPPSTLEAPLPVVLRPVYSGDGLLAGEDGGGTSTEVADFAGENDGTGEGVGGEASVKIISSWTSATNREKVSS